ncbi:hypothetical protein VCHENC02_3666A, partial [Vibrio harveyi]
MTHLPESFLANLDFYF